MHEILKHALRIFLIMNPIGMMPTIDSIIKKITKIPKERNKLILKAIVLCSLFALLIFFSGTEIINLIEAKISSIQIGGGIILFFIGTKMIFPKRDKNKKHITSLHHQTIAPIVSPLTCGPGTIAKILIIKSKASSFIIGLLSVCIGVSVSMIVMYVSLYFSKYSNFETNIVLQLLSSIILLLYGIVLCFEGLASQFLL